LEPAGNGCGLYLEPADKEKIVATDQVRKLSRSARRERIHLRVRTRVSGTPERPRLCVYRSNGNIYAQVVDDRSGRTLASASSIDKDTRKDLKGGSNVAAAKVIGKKIAERTRAAGIEQVVFDRGGYMYHGRVEALAAAAREAGLKF
jgi:large subunit ribosomal protein L18